MKSERGVKVTEKDVQYVADLANLELTLEEQARMVRDMNAILGHIDTLNELDTSNVEPMAQVSEKFGVDASKTGTVRFSYAWREDVVTPSLDRDEVMKGAPMSDGEFFRVPKVIEK
jgi:aspartyl-tRNA(Asn)/glutamyl-tRNA(Gln) amidotransferase subunit C